MDGLKGRRQALKAAEWYQAWHSKHKGEALASPPAAATGPALVGYSSSSSADADAADGGDPLSDDRRRHAAALLSAIDAALLGLRFESLGGHRSLGFHFATFSPSASGAKVPAAEWMHAVLKYGQYQQKLAELSEEAKLLKAYSSYSVFAHTLLYTLFRTWVQQTVSGAKPYLALPTKDEAEAFIKSISEEGGSQRSAKGPLFSR